MVKFLKVSISILVMVVVFNCLIVNQSFASNEIKVNIEGKNISFDVPPAQINGRTLVPLRAIFEALGVSVQWDESTKTITGTKGQKTIILKVDSTDAVVDGEHKTLDTAATTINSRVLVPARFISESLGMHVAWNGDIQTVNISENQIIEWKYEGYEGVEPYKEYESKFVDGVKSTETRYTGKNHEFKKVTLYSTDGRVAENVPENKISIYGEGWSTTPPAKVIPTIPSIPLSLDSLRWIPVYKTNNKGEEYIDIDMENSRIKNNSIGTPELKLVAHNNTNKEIVAFEFSCKFQDSFGRVVNKVGSNDPVYKGIVQNTNLMGNEIQFKETKLYSSYLSGYVKARESSIIKGTAKFDDVWAQGEKTAKIVSDVIHNREYTFNLVLYNTATDIVKGSFKVLKVKYADGTTWDAS